jgi:predicted transcriptional regulator
MDPVGGERTAVGEPTIDELLQTVFGMSNAELDVCLCVMESGEQTVRELAETTEYERSVVSRHLNHLADLGVLNKQRRLLKKGGHVYVYSARGPEAIRESFRAHFFTWVSQLDECIDTLNRRKVESLVDGSDEESHWRIYQE